MMLSVQVWVVEVREGHLVVLCFDVFNVSDGVSIGLQRNQKVRVSTSGSG